MNEGCWKGVLTIAATETSGDDGDLGTVRMWWPEGPVLETDVVGAIENDCLLGGESDRGHC
jgi:hypothetical protein